MTVAVSLALALTLSQPAPPVEVVVSDIGSRAFIVKQVGLDRLPDDSQLLRGWLCRRAPGAPIRRLAVIAEDRAGNSIWKGVATTPAFAPGRTRECRVLRIDLPPHIASQAKAWRLERP